GAGAHRGRRAASRRVGRYVGKHRDVAPAVSRVTVDPVPSRSSTTRGGGPDGPPPLVHVFRKERTVQVRGARRDCAGRGGAGGRTPCSRGGGRSRGWIRGRSPRTRGRRPCSSARPG